MRAFKVIGLVSGGKDSTYNLMHCVANGHTLVALATLTPTPGIDELDSHMYQSVGTNLIPMLADALELPHYSKVIQGTAISQGAEYGSRNELRGVEGDEAEDLYELLKTVLESHPADAIASGAILSNYQRLRIEHVARRLGLVSLSYLWQQPQLPLIKSMIEAEMDVILVKVAGIGFKVGDVGKGLSAMYPSLQKLLYGSHAAGEGGEYETLTLSTPLFSQKLRIIDSQVIVTDPEPSLVAYLKINNATLDSKPGWIRPSREAVQLLVGETDILDTESRSLLDEVEVVEIQGPEALFSDNWHGYPQDPRRSSAVSNWTSHTISGSSGDVANQIHACFAGLGNARENAVHVTLLLSDMTLFGEANAAYSRYFGTSPPSRATVAVPLPRGEKVRMEVLSHHLRPETLHVQSLSYWAPANIGPYSQAASIEDRVIIAGQVPLVPATLETVESSYRLQSILALQHVSRIISVLRSPNTTGGGWQGSIESCIVWWVASPIALDGWRSALQAWELWAKTNEAREAPILFVQATALPKESLVEFQVNVNKSADLPIASSGMLGPAWWEGVSGPGNVLRRAIFSQESSQAAVSAVQTLLSNVITVKVFYTAQAGTVSSILGSEMSPSIGVLGIPVHSIHDRRGKAAVWAMEVFYASE